MGYGRNATKEEIEAISGTPGEVSGTIVRVFRAGPTWSSGILEVKGGRVEVPFTGFFFAKQGDRVVLRGEWDTWNGRDQFKASRGFEYDTRLDGEALANFLAKSPRFQGIGFARARAIVDACSMFSSFEAGLMEHAEEVAKLAGVKQSIVYAVREEWSSRASVNRAMAELSKFGVGPGRATALVESHGTAVVATVKGNPYWLIGRVPGFGFRTVDAIALEVGIAKNDPKRIREAIVAALDDEERDGHTWTEYDSLIAKAQGLLALDDLDPRAPIAEQVAAMSVEGVDPYRHAVSSLASKGGELVAVFRRKTLAAEAFAVRSILENAHGPRNGAISDEQVEAFVQSKFSYLNEGQIAAVRGAAQERIVLLAGGAGVGKTTTVGAIFELLAKSGASIALAAPTGKAAKRMEQVVGSAASTIHVLLHPIFAANGSSKRQEEEELGTDATDADRASTKKTEAKFQFGFGGPGSPDGFLPHDVIIVDEVSMIDVALLASLIRAIDFSRTSLVLVGDHNQLPSVGAGAVLRDLFVANGRNLSEGLSFPLVCHLQTVMRSAGELRSNVAGILAGDVAPTSEGEVPANEMKPWYVTGSNATTPDATALQLVRIFELDRFVGKVATIDGVEQPIDEIRDVQVLTPIHKGPIGTIALNHHLQRVMQAKRGVTVPTPKNLANRPKPMAGDKVIFTKNDYVLGLMNGSIGVVESVDPKTSETRVFFEGMEGEVVIKGEALRHLEVAYAITVHKSQGSEFPVAIVVAHSAHSFFLHRGIIYTAASRARTSAVLVGDPWAMKRAAKKVVANVRRTLASSGDELLLKGLRCGEVVEDGSDSGLDLAE